MNMYIIYIAVATMVALLSAWVTYLLMQKKIEKNEENSIPKRDWEAGDMVSVISSVKLKDTEDNYLIAYKKIENGEEKDEVFLTIRKYSPLDVPSKRRYFIDKKTHWHAIDR